MAKTQTAATLVAAATKTAATTTRGRWDVSNQDGGVLTAAITNGATAPTAQCVMTVLIAHKQVGGMPAAAGESSGSADWKRVAQIGGGLSSGSTIAGRTPLTYHFGPEVAYIEIEFGTHTGNDVTVEAYGTSFVYS